MSVRRALSRVEQSVGAPEWRRARLRALRSPLTAREREVLRLLADGLAPTQIAASLGISPKTVATHVEHIYAKLGVHARAQAVASAFRLSMVET